MRTIDTAQVIAGLTEAIEGMSKIGATDSAHHLEEIRARLME